ncbi:MAG: protein kinase domain-containing protein, partial [Streptosporangiales bacterium]
MTSYAPLARGRVLVSGYRVEEHLARGETLDVYSVRSEERECMCVAKTVRADRRDDTAARDRLLREGALLHRLDRPHLVRGYESRESPPVAVLETLANQTLSHLLSVRKQGLTVPDLLRLGLQLCSVVRYLHRSGILHLDLKPSNMVVDAGRLRVLDLSHARPPG